MQCYRCSMRMSVDGESYSCDCGYTIPINTANTAFYAQAAVDYAQAAVAEVQARGERIAELEAELAAMTTKAETLAREAGNLMLAAEDAKRQNRTLVDVLQLADAMLMEHHDVRYSKGKWGSSCPICTEAKLAVIKAALDAAEGEGEQ